MQVEKATLQFLKEIEMLSDTEGRYIFYLAKQFTDKKKGCMRETSLITLKPVY